MDTFNLSEYETLGKHVLKNGRLKENRTGINTIGIFGYQMRFNLSRGEFPLVTTKKVFTRGIFEELKWFIKGETNIKPLTDKGVHIWDSWATEEGEVGPIYGEIWRRFPTGVPIQSIKEIVNTLKKPVGENDPVIDIVSTLESLINRSEYHPIDQLSTLLTDLEKRPFSRRHLVTAWAPSVLPDETMSPQENVKRGRQALAACHTFWQVYVEQMSHEEAVSYRNAYFNNAITALNFDLRTNSSKISVEDKPHLLEELKQEQVQLCALLDKVLIEHHEFLSLVVNDPNYEGGLLPRKRISMQMYQRSADLPLGVPFNIASYAALLQLIATKVGMVPGDLIHTIGDAHVYVDQIELFTDQVSRATKRPPVLLISGVKNTRDWSDVDDYEFKVIGYDHHPAIKYPSAAV